MSYPAAPHYTGDVALAGYPDHTTESVSNKPKRVRVRTADGCAHAERLRAVTILTVESARELIPYVCFYNGLAVLEEMKENSDKPVNPPVDLLEGFKKKREFILGLQSHSSPD